LRYSIFSKVVHSATTQHQYTVNNTQFWLHVSVVPNHLQVSISYMEVHSLCTYIMGYRKGKGKVHPCTGTEGSRGIAVLYRH